jgi:hypothetical protein
MLLFICSKAITNGPCIAFSTWVSIENAVLRVSSKTLLCLKIFEQNR